MDNEALFVMLEDCVERASQELMSSQNLHSFAVVMDENDETRIIEVHEIDGEKRYETLLEILRMEAEAENIIAFALLSNVTIPENFNPQVSSGIRIHVEEKAFQADNKLSARLLYVPYQLYKTASDDTIQIQLHNPIPVGLACEVFI